MHNATQPNRTGQPAHLFSNIEPFFSLHLFIRLFPISRLCQTHQPESRSMVLRLRMLYFLKVNWKRSERKKTIKETMEQNIYLHLTLFKCNKNKRKYQS